MKTAVAATNILYGTMILKVTFCIILLILALSPQVKPDGSAYVKGFSFSKPDKVDVKEAINFRQETSGEYFKNAIHRMRPVAAGKILKAARSLLSQF